ncbi:hypothetical protein RchiOBHm_Chr6g0268331 [Rosa chinensis]|uniref:Uncharacterized protein n=1 Tax=Rosa chinensis TaxID=74649 RepID=A0A2P6PQ58_ROSCH|nr:hypothetical protein RchiOBHm_Chr6g0268331 [Rosa chinensis]
MLVLYQMELGAKESTCVNFNPSSKEYTHGVAIRFRSCEASFLHKPFVLGCNFNRSACLH